MSIFQGVILFWLLILFFFYELKGKEKRQNGKGGIIVVKCVRVAAINYVL